MKKSYKIIKTYEEKTYDSLLSVTVIKIKDKCYTGVAKLHPDDIKYYSHFAGYEIAEYRAYIKYLKEEKQNVKRELETLIKLRNRINCYKHIDRLDSEKLIVNKSIDMKQKELNEIEERITSYINLIPKVIKIRQDIVKKMCKIHDESSKGANA